MEELGKPLPYHVQKEFDEYLKCGRLEHGFTPGIRPFALRASLWLFKIAPDDFVSLHAGIAAQAWERDKLERLCR